MCSGNDSNDVITTKTSFNNNDNSPLWIVLMDQSQLVMTIFGLIASIATSLTLIKNIQVGGPYLF